jgi:hypothetical protein
MKSYDILAQHEETGKQGSTFGFSGALLLGSAAVRRARGKPLQRGLAILPSCLMICMRTTGAAPQVAKKRRVIEAGES